MGGERVRRGRGTPARTTAYAACAAVLLGGCASMPDSGDLRGVESTPRKDTQVRVYAMPPSEDATPTQIVQGFLEAPAQRRTARPQGPRGSTWPSAGRWGTAQAGVLTDRPRPPTATREVREDAPP
ncbi:Lipoprotein LpqB [Streptomyces griseoloalbus]